MSMQVGAFELDVPSHELRDGNRTIRLQAQPFEILCALLERPGDVITRDELRRRLWPDGTFVDFEHSLNTAIKRLRAVLRDNASRPTFIETVHRRGYRYIANQPSRRHGSRLRLVVLPFSALCDDVGCERFSEGLTEEVIVQLGSLAPEMEIVAPSSARFARRDVERSRDIAGRLHATVLLEGSTRHDGSRARITARLVDAATEVHVWSEMYERVVDRPLSVQADVGRSVARAIMQVLPAARTGAHWS